MLMSRRTVPSPSPALAKRHQIFLKRLMDVCGSLFLLLLLAPLLVVIAIFVKIDDGGPVFYRRRCVGQKGEFDAFKFRSMRVDADEILRSDPVLWNEFQKDFKLSHDPRVTRVGTILRKTSLDELPQLWNVLRGEMSLVGPRMITAPELEKYGDARELLLAVRPGLTGSWQVSGRQTVGYEQRVRMDIVYISTWSLMSDIRILLKTPLAVFKAHGAY